MATEQQRSTLKRPIQTINQIHVINISGNNPLTVLGKIAGLLISLLIDSEASLTLVNRKLFSQLPLHFYHQVRYPMSLTFLQLRNGFKFQGRYVLRLPITIANSTRIHTVYVVPRSLQMCIISNDLIRKT